MLLLGEQDFAASGHDSFDANSLVMVTLRQSTSWGSACRFLTPRSLAGSHTQHTSPATRLSPAQTLPAQVNYSPTFFDGQRNAAQLSSNSTPAQHCFFWARACQPNSKRERSERAPRQINTSASTVSASVPDQLSTSCKSRADQVCTRKHRIHIYPIVV